MLFYQLKFLTQKECDFVCGLEAHLVIRLSDRDMAVARGRLQMGNDCPLHNPSVTYDYLKELKT